MRPEIKRGSSEQGQATIMVTLALLAMCGLIGLAVDFGWAFYVRRAAQAAADSAALASTRAALKGSPGSIDCVSLGCEASPISCSSVTSANLSTACAYAARNGFAPGGDNGHQSVTIQAGTGTAPTASGVSNQYWTTVRVSETVPQLFSAVMGHPLATVAARSTGAVTEVVVTGSLILLNRSGDASPAVGAGTNLSVQGGGTVTASGGVLMASNSSSAGVLGGSSRVINTAFTHILGTGRYTLGGASSAWQNTPTNGYSDGSQFFDPMRGKGQPPAPSSILSPVPIAGGTISGGTSSNPTVLYPGNYYATTSCGTGCVQASAAPITLGSGYFTFSNNGAGFGNYIFYGGLATGSGTTVVTFAPGRYIFAGTNNGNASFSINNGTTLQDNTATAGVPASDAGEIFVFTDLNYPGLSAQIPAAVTAQSSLFSYGSAGFKSGSNTKSSVNLHGLNLNDPSLPVDLQPFAPVVMWQDQGNSHIKYTSDGNIDTTCAGATIENPCTNSRVAANASSPELDLLSSASAKLYGAVYQPRGGWMVINGSGSSAGPLQIVTGALSVQGSGTVLLKGLVNPLTMLTAALVE